MKPDDNAAIEARRLRHDLDRLEPSGLAGAPKKERHNSADVPNEY